MKSRYFILTTFMSSLLSQFSADCSDNQQIEEAEKIVPKNLSMRHKNTKSWKELSSPSLVSPNSEICLRPIPVGNKFHFPTEKSNEVDIVNIDNTRKSTTQPSSNILDRDREVFYNKCKVHSLFQKYTTTEFEKPQNTNYLRSLYMMYQSSSTIEGQQKLIKELIDSGKLLSETLFLKEKSYRERIKSYRERIKTLEGIIEEGKESLNHIKSDHSNILKDKDRIIGLQKANIQGKTDSEKKITEKIKHILEKMGIDEIESDTISNLNLIEDLISQNCKTP